MDFPRSKLVRLAHTLPRCSIPFDNPSTSLHSSNAPKSLVECPQVTLRLTTTAPLPKLTHPRYRRRPANPGRPPQLCRRLAHNRPESRLPPNNQAPHPLYRSILPLLRLRPANRHHRSALHHPRHLGRILLLPRPHRPRVPRRSDLARQP